MGFHQLKIIFYMFFVWDIRSLALSFGAEVATVGQGTQENSFGPRKTVKVK